MHFQLFSTLFIALLATEVSAEILYRRGNSTTPVPTRERLLIDFGALVEGRFIHRAEHGLSTYNARHLVTGNHIYTTSTEAVSEAAGFHVVVDGEPGHRSIGIVEGETILEADLPGRLQAIGWVHVDDLENSDVAQILLTHGGNE